MIVDESLNWSRHVKTVIAKMSRYVGIMYKIKKLLPLKARLQIYHSFVQSHINFCSLVWGFSCKSNIEAIFCKQKKGLRAVIPGFINYNYKNGTIPGHTKQYFNEYNILTIHNIIALNALVMLNKIRSFPSLLPNSIVATIPTYSPEHGSTHDDCEKWLKTYNTPTYRNSLFFKGPLLYSTTNFVEHSDIKRTTTPNIFKNKVKKVILDCQGEGETIEWEVDNFALYKCKGLRAGSNKRNKETVRYTQFF